MGNILCLPKKRKKSDLGASKKQRKRSSKKSDRNNGTKSDERARTCDLEDAKPSNDSADRTDPQIRRSRSPEVYVCPVVSSSILLRHDHEEEDSDRKRLKDHGGKEQVYLSNRSSDIETRSTASGDISSKLNIKNERTVVASAERLSEEITPTTREIARQEEPVATVRVINVQEVKGSLSPVSAHIGKYTEALVETIQPGIWNGAQVASKKSVELEEANKSSGSKITPTDPGGPRPDMQKEIEKSIGTETIQGLICPSAVEGKMKEIHMDVSSEQVIEDKEKVKRSRFTVERVDEPTKQDVDDTKAEYEKENCEQKPEIHILRGVEMVDCNQTSDRDRHIAEEKHMLDYQHVTNVFVKSTDEVSNKPRGYPKHTACRRHDTNISRPVVEKVVPELMAIAGIPDVETPTRENTIKLTGSSLSVSEKRHVSSHMKEFGAVLNVLSTLQIPAEKTKDDPVVPVIPASGTKRYVFGPQSDSSDKLGEYKSKQGIETWMKQSSLSRKDNNTPVSSTSAKKVSDFLVPWKPRKLPQKPLSLKKPSLHLYKIPDVAKSDSDDDDGKVNWTQVEPRGPQTEVLWTTKPSAFDVKLPPLPKRLLERKGSVEKLQEMWIIPQVKQIETLKREYGRFPGLVVPTALRKNYSVDTNKEVVTDDENDNSDADTYRNTNDEDCNQEIDKASKRDN